MKIMQFMPAFGLAGAEIMCENLTYELINAGNEVIVVSLYDYHSPITERLENKNITIEYLGKKQGIDFSIFRKIRNTIKRYRPDVIHTHLYLLKYVAIAALGTNIRGIVHTVHNIAQKENNYINRFINGILFKNSKIIPVALSEKVKETIINSYKINANQIPIVNNGLVLPVNVKPRNYSINSKINIINIGRYTPAKNHLTLIESIADLHQEFPNIRLNLYGSGELKEKIHSLIKNLKAEDYILENGLSDKIYEELNKADIFILPSLYEGMPMTIIEAMGIALPIIASNVGGIPDMISHGYNGLLCSNDKISIKDNLRKLIMDENLRKHIGENAYNSSKKFSATNMAKNYINIYSNLFKIV